MAILHSRYASSLVYSLHNSTVYSSFSLLLGRGTVPPKEDAMEHFACSYFVRFLVFTFAKAPRFLITYEITRPVRSLKADSYFW